MNKILVNFIVILTLVLTSCTSAPLLPVIDESAFIKVNQKDAWWKSYNKERLAREEWQLEGAFRTNDPDAIVSGLNFNWIEQDGADTVYYFTTTFGVQVASINYVVDTNELTLTLGGDYYGPADSRNELNRRGLSTPLEMIRYWIKGIPDPRFPAEVYVNPDKTIAKIVQHGVDVHYTKFLASGLPAEFYISEESSNGLVLAMYVYDYYE